MSTPTTVKFQIVVPSKNENGLSIEKTYSVEMSLTVESESGEAVNVRVEGVSLPQPPSVQPVPTDAIPPPSDPPKIVN